MQNVKFSITNHFHHLNYQQNLTYEFRLNNSRLANNE